MNIKDNQPKESHNKILLETEKSISKDLYSAIYKNLEHEFINLSNLIHIDDEQIKTYSIKISELLIRAAVEIESISKELYLLNDGPSKESLFFDTDCIDFLEEKWKLSKKVINVSLPNLYFKSSENKTLTPLKNANKRGKNDWKKAYQAVKHNRSKNLKEGNLKHLIRALGALYILNIYYRDTTFLLEEDYTGTNFDLNLGSELFSVKLHPCKKDINQNYTIRSDYNECIYLIKKTDETEKKSNELYNNTLLKISKEIDIPKNSQKMNEEDMNNLIKQSLRNNRGNLTKPFKILKFEATLNKQQFEINNN